MKIRTISRSADDYVSVSKDESARTPRNLNPEMHPFERAREYTRALNATKLDRMFAAPFLAQMGDGHVDGVYSLAKSQNSLGMMASGSGDGVVKLWDLGSTQETKSIEAHRGIVRGLCFTPDNKLLSCSNDKTVKLWSSLKDESLQTYLSESGLNSVDHHRDESKFVTAGAKLELWDIARSKPITSLSWSIDGMSSVRFNKTETSICATTGTDRSLVLYDIRTQSPVQKTVLEMASNAIAWNPIEAFNFAVANEDHNAYMFDMRNMKRAINIYKDHVAAVMDLDFSPTGQELVTGSYDRTIRIYRLLDGHSRDIYHTRRMQRVFAVNFSMDAKYIVSGSDDGNVRLWRARANDRSGIKTARQRTKEEHDAALVKRYQHLPGIRRIAKSRHLPEAVKKARDIKREELDAIRRRRDNLARNSRKGTVEYKSEREKHILGSAVDYERNKSKK